MSFHIESLHFRLQVAEIMEDEKEISKLLKEIRDYKINIILNKNNIEEEKDYFDDETE